MLQHKQWELAKLFKLFFPSLTIDRAIAISASMGRAKCDDRELRDWAAPTVYDDRRKAAEDVSKLFDAPPGGNRSAATPDHAYARYYFRRTQAELGAFTFDDDQLWVAATMIATDL